MEKGEKWRRSWRVDRIEEEESSFDISSHKKFMCKTPDLTNDTKVVILLYY